MAFIISITICAAWVASVGILGLIGHHQSEESERIAFLKNQYRCSTETAKELILCIRKAGAHHIFKSSGLTL